MAGKDQLPFGDKGTSGGSSGGHDFVTDPKSGAPATGGRDFTKESRPQKSGSDPVNPEDAIGGGKPAFPDFPDPAGKGCGSIGNEKRPFKVKGG